MKKFRVSENFIKHLIELTDGRLTSVEFDLILDLINLESKKYFFTNSSESNLLRIISAVHDRIFFLKEFTRYPHHCEILMAIASTSNYLTDIIVRNPEYLYQIFDQEYLSRDLNYELLQNEISNCVDRYKSLNSKIHFLRQAKKRFILKIGLNDILNIFPLKKITEQLSALANSICSVLFEICYKEVLSKYNIQYCSNRYCLCSLGKLGGMELNYSSDIDLILFYDSNEQIQSVKKDYGEILSEAAQLFIKTSTEISDNGFIYRIDFRLRPDGMYSSLCNSFDEYIRYYETRGEDWEKQMLIKLGFTGGDFNLFTQFNNFVQSFIYSLNPSHSVKNKILQMKLSIEKQKSGKENIKTISGGIRDIEFSIQALQLLNGSKLKDIKNSNTLESISALAYHKILKRNEEKILTKAYVFYRRIEHFLQLMNNRQTYSIPEESDLLNGMINYLNIKTVSDFRKKLKLNRNTVRKIYNDILAPDSTKQSARNKSINFKDQNRAASNLIFLRTGTGLINRKGFDSRTIEAFLLIEPILNKYLQKCIQPGNVLENFVKVIRATKNPHIWYSQFNDPKYLNTFLNICQYANKAIDLISSDYLLEELYLSGNIFSSVDESSIKDYSLKQLFLLLSVQYALGKISEREVSTSLTIAIDNILEKELNQFLLKNKLLIVHSGSFGIQSVDFGSDIDLIIFSEDYIANDKIEKRVVLLLEKLKDKLHPFEIDFRLRPEGKSSQLIWDFKHFKDYLQKRARTWEYQTLLKQNSFNGNEKLFVEYRKLISKCFDKFDKRELQKDISSMYKTILRQNVRTADNSFNMKKDKGGLLTIDFILQYLALTETEPYKINFQMTEVLDSLKQKLVDEDLKLIQKNFYFLKKAVLSNQILFNTSNSVIPAAVEKRKMLSQFLKYKSVEDFNRRISEVIQTNNNLFDKYVGK